MAPKKKTGKFLKNGEGQVDEFYEQMPAKKEKKSSSARPVAITFAILCVCICIVASVFFLGKLGISITLPGRTISAGVTVAGVDVGGLKKNEAVEALSAAVGDSYAANTLVVTVLDKELAIAPAVSGAELDIEGAVREAFRYGTEGNPETKVDILPFITLSEEAIRNLIADFAVNFPTEGIETGSQIIKETVDGEECEVLEVTIGTVFYDFSADALYEAILEAYGNYRFQANYACNQISAASIDLDALYAEYCTEAVEAVLDPETHEVTQSSNGYRFDLEGAKEALANANPGDVLKFPFQDVLPAMDTETLQSMLFRDELGSCTAYQSSGSDRATNLRLACEAINGLILYPGDTFSYNGTLGERTPEKGYRPAAAYLNGKTIQSYGGGICQPSSALYYACLHADLEIVQRHCHTYPSSYVPFGMDATVDWNGPDYKFKNNTDFPIRIEAKADGGSVTVKLIGTDVKDYYVKMEYEILSVSYPKTIEKEVKPGSGHKDGEVETSAYTGYTVQSYKLKYDKETDELISREKEAYSVYSKRDKVVYRVKDDAKKEETTTPTDPAPTEPTPTEPKPTEPKPTEPTPTEPKPTEPKPTEPEPKPTEPKPTEPKPTVGEAGSDSETPGE